MQSCLGFGQGLEASAETVVPPCPSGVYPAGGRAVLKPARLGAASHRGGRFSSGGIGALQAVACLPHARTSYHCSSQKGNSLWARRPRAAAALHLRCGHTVFLALCAVLGWQQCCVSLTHACCPPSPPGTWSDEVWQGQEGAFLRGCGLSNYLTLVTGKGREDARAWDTRDPWPSRLLGDFSLGSQTP